MIKHSNNLEELTRETHITYKFDVYVQIQRDDGTWTRNEKWYSFTSQCAAFMCARAIEAEFDCTAKVARAQIVDGQTGEILE